MGMYKIVNFWEKHWIPIVETTLVIGIVVLICYLAHGWELEYSEYDFAVLIDESSAEYLYQSCASPRLQVGKDRSCLYEYEVDGKAYRFAVSCGSYSRDVDISTCPIRISSKDPKKILIDMNWFTEQAEPRWVFCNS